MDVPVGTRQQSKGGRRALSTRRRGAEIPIAGTYKFGRRLALLNGTSRTRRSAAPADAERTPACALQERAGRSSLSPAHGPLPANIAAPSRRPELAVR